MELLRVSGAGMRFGQRRALEGASLHVRAGEAVAVVGENGAGKTTLLRICAGLLAPDSGDVAVHGRVGYCPQQPGLLDLLTAEEHVGLFAPGLRLSRGRALAEGRKLLAELGLPADDVATPAGELSGGGRQKLNLALALLGDPQVLLLDEPYQGFDRGGYVSFWEHVDRWRDEGRAVVVVTHLLAEPVRVDRVVELRVAT